MPTYSNSDLAVMLIDMQKSFFNGVYSSERERLEKSQLQVIKHCYTHNIPIIHVEYINHGKTISKIQRALAKTSTILILKSAPDVFSENGLGSIIRDKLQRNTLFLMGLYASECVYSSGWAAKDLGFEVITAEDVIADHMDTAHNILEGREISLESFYNQKNIKLYNSYKDFFNIIDN